MRQRQGPYRYEAAVEEFLRFSPSVRKDNAAPGLRRLGTRELSDLRRAIELLEDDAPRNVAPGETRAATPASTPPRRPAAGPRLDELEPDELVAILPSLYPDDLAALRAHEAANAGRESILRAIDGLLAGRGASTPKG